MGLPHLFACMSAWPKEEIRSAQMPCDHDGAFECVGHMPVSECRHGQLEEIRWAPGAVVNTWRNAHLLGGHADEEERSGA